MMPLQLASLNSGSNANCYYIGNDNEAVLIDAGLSCKETEIRLKRLSLSIDKIKGIFISHEHYDHIKGLARLSKKHQIPVYITHATLANSNLNLEKHLILAFDERQPIQIGDLVISAFIKLHDAAHPHSFTVSNCTTKIGVFTDLGDCCTNLIDNFKNCNAAILEANYDDEMLKNGNYPYYLKERISGGYGHLSNDKALDLFLKYRTEKLSHLILAHLSEHNNRPDLVHKIFKNQNTSTKIIVAPRHQETDLYLIGQ